MPVQTRWSGRFVALVLLLCRARGARGRSARRLSVHAQGRGDRRLQRHEGGRPLPVARGPRLSGDRDLHRDPEQGRVRLPRGDPREGSDPEAADRALELPAHGRALPRGGQALSTAGTPACTGSPRSSREPPRRRSPGCSSTPTRSRPTAPSRCRRRWSPRTGSTSPTGSPRAAPTGRPSTSWRSPPARSWRTAWNGSASPASAGRRTARGSSTRVIREPPKGQELSAPLLNQRIYYHRVGTPQSADRLIFERKDNPTWFVSSGVTEDGRFLVVNVARGSDPKNLLYYAPSATRCSRRSTPRWCPSSRSSSPISRSSGTMGRRSW